VQIVPEPESVVGAHQFVSLDGRFSVSLPKQNHAYSELAVPTPFGDAKGSFYQWTMKEGVFGAGYADAAQVVDNPEVAQKVFDKVREELQKLATKANGTVSELKPIKLDKYPGVEQRLTTFTGSLLQRTYLAGRRVYQIMAVTKNTQQMYEGVAAGVLDSFKIMSEADAAAAMAREAAKAEPSPLPQTPVTRRDGTDATDEGLKGRVKTVLTESQDLSGTWSIQTRMRNSFTTYNELGNKVRTELYDHRGNLSDIRVYGYIDGSRVSDFKTIRHEYDLPISIGPAPGATGRKFDPRYQYRFEYKYDERKRLTEWTYFHSDGAVWQRYVYKYDGKQKEEMVYSADGKLNRRSLLVLDDKGNKVEETLFETSGAVRTKTSYVYEFDSPGNWIKRTSSEIVSDGREQMKPQSVYYRTITYY